jgi:hypothetical protein
MEGAVVEVARSMRDAIDVSTVGEMEGFEPDSADDDEGGRPEENVARRIAAVWWWRAESRAVIRLAWPRPGDRAAQVKKEEKKSSVQKQLFFLKKCIFFI